MHLFHIHERATWEPRGILSRIRSSFANAPLVLFVSDSVSSTCLRLLTSEEFSMWPNTD